MKIKRYKKVIRHINFYVNNFKFRQPYQLLIDGTFCYAALNNQVNIADNVPRYLQGELKLLTTQCQIIEMENLGAKLNGALLVLKQFSLHKCGHEGKPVSGAQCILSMVGKMNDRHYLIATQDRDLQSKLRDIPGIPLLYLHMKTPVLDPPSTTSLRAVEINKANIFNPAKEKIEEMKKKSGILGDEEKRSRKKKIKGPNPLSCKKKKKIDSTRNNVIKAKKDKINEQKEKRKKIRIPKHIKDVLSNSTN